MVRRRNDGKRTLEVMLIKLWRLVQHHGCGKQGSAGVPFSVMPSLVMKIRNKHSYMHHLPVLMLQPFCQEMALCPKTKDLKCHCFSHFFHLENVSPPIIVGSVRLSMILTNLQFNSETTGGYFEFREYCLLGCIYFVVSQKAGVSRMPQHIVMFTLM